jgi:hypothetical protein
MFRPFFTTIFRGSFAVLCAVTIPPTDLRSLSLYYYTVCGRMCMSSVRLVFLPASRREGGGCGFTLSRSHSCRAVRLVYTQISPNHIWTTLYFNFQTSLFNYCAIIVKMEGTGWFKKKRLCRLKMFHLMMAISGQTVCQNILCEWYS